MTCYKNIRIDAGRVQQGGRTVHLTRTELELLLYLLDNAGRIATRPELLADVWGITAPVQTRTVDIHVAHLRRKLALQNDLVSVMRRGYTLLPETDEQPK